MSNSPTVVNEAALAAQVQALLADPEHQNNPLRAPLAALLECNEAHLAQTARLIKISDGYQDITHHRQQTLEQQYARQLRRVEKLSRISDRYQNSLRELSESLKEASLRDVLTGLGNRRFLMERLQQETERASRKGTPFVLGILDIDHFKSVNDRFGHDAGDTALCAVARAMEAALRDYDLCGRWGGEEFLIMLPETPLDQALQVAQRVCQDIKNLRFDFMEGHISTSLGLSLYRLGEPFAQTLNRADAALLEAKSTGRDRVKVSLD